MSHLNSGIAVIGIDIGKNSFHLVGQDRRGAIVLRQKWSRGQVEARLANLPPCLVGMEACVGAHHLSRKLQLLGHNARLMPAKYVRPYSKGQKNDFRDAEAIAEAVQRPTMKFVATKLIGSTSRRTLHPLSSALTLRCTHSLARPFVPRSRPDVAARYNEAEERSCESRLTASPTEAIEVRLNEQWVVPLSCERLIQSYHRRRDRCPRCEARMITKNGLKHRAFECLKPMTKSGGISPCPIPGENSI